MRKLLFLIIAVQLFFVSCVPKPEKDQNLSIIEKVENNLLPPIIIEGEELVTYNIYDRMKHYNVPAVSIAFIDGGKIEWAKGYGYTSFDSLNAVDENTMFQAASISKPVAAMAALSLVEEGMLDLDNNVNEYLKGWQVIDNEFTKIEKVTLRRILTHSAGLTVHGFGGYASKDSIPTLLQILNGEAPANSDAVIPDIVPGTMNRYSGGGYTLMQKMLIDISGETFPSLMDERVLSKIGMGNSTYIQPLPEKFYSRAAIAHRSNGEMIEGRWHTYPEMAAAGLWTTPTDLLKYALEVQSSLAGKSNLILSQKMTEEMLTRQIASQGLGLGLSGEGDSLIFRHGGANEGYRCELLAMARLSQGVAIMTNSDNGGALMNEIIKSFSRVYGWSFQKPRSKTIYPIEPDKLNDFAGQFKWDQDELIAEITVKNNHLEGIQIWDGMRFEIYPESELKFFNKEDGATFEFKKNEDGKITEILIQRQYRFVKID